MSQRGVERVIGKLVTDEGFRRCFAEDPGAALRQATEDGVELNEGELRALAGISARVASRFAEALDPRLQKTDLANESR
jgi:putative modified peptide